MDDDFLDFSFSSEKKKKRVKVEALESPPPELEDTIQKSKLEKKRKLLDFEEKSKLKKNRKILDFEEESFEEKSKLKKKRKKILDFEEESFEEKSKLKKKRKIVDFEEESSPGKKLTWTEEEDQILLDTALSLAPDSQKSYRLSWKNFDWSNISSEVKKPKSECLTRLKNLTSCAIQTKTMQQILLATKADLLKIRKNSFVLPIVKWSKLNEAKILEYMQTHNIVDKMAAAEKIWNDLDRYTKDRFSKKTSVLLKPFDIYMESYSKSHPEVKKNIWNLARKEYALLKPKRKFKYIKKYIQTELSKGEITQEAIDQLELTQAEAELYLKHLGMPDTPEKSVQMLYFAQTGFEVPQSKEKLMVIQNTFAKLPEAEQKHWSQKFAAEWDDFKILYSDWIQEQEEHVSLLINKFCYKLVKMTTSKFTKATKESKPKRMIKYKRIQFHAIEMPITSCTFEGEPKIFRNPISTFQENSRKKGIKFTRDELKKAYGELSDDESLKCEIQCYEDKKQAEETLLNLVNSQPPEQQKVFLGFRRERYYKIFKKDIFAKKFPDKDFPVYVKPKKNKGKTIDLQEVVAANKEFEQALAPSDSESDVPSSPFKKRWRNTMEQDNSSSE